MLYQLCYVFDNSKLCQRTAVTHRLSFINKNSDKDKCLSLNFRQRRDALTKRRHETF